MRYISPKTKLNKKNKRAKRKWLFLLIIIIFVSFLFSRLSIGSFFSPLSVFSQIVNPVGLLSSDGRTNILLLGLDRREEDLTGLTDTMVLASMNKKDENDIVLISLPRDLWISLGEGSFAKINAAYSKGGVESSEDAVENALGVPVHYSIVVDFEGFKKAVDILGGIEINVEREFDDYYYPIPGMETATCELEENKVVELSTKDPVPDKDLVEIENEQFGYPCRFEHIHFGEGREIMDGDTALKFARSRHGTNNEGNDFARAARQHKAILAINNRVVGTNFISDLGKIKDLYNTYRDYVETDLGITELERIFTKYSGVDIDNIKTVVLDNESGVESGGLLFTPRDRTLYGGAYVLLPRAGDFTQIHAFVQKLLFGGQ